MIIEFYTPLGPVSIDTLTATDAEWSVISMPPDKIAQYRLQAQYEHEFNEKHVQALEALKHWTALTPAQKDTILKNILEFILFKEGYLGKVL